MIKEYRVFVYTEKFLRNLNQPLNRGGIKDY